MSRTSEAASPSRHAQAAGAAALSSELDRRAVPLGDVGSDDEARLLAGRLVAERIGARAEGTVVWVAATELDDALVMARLFHEVDEGGSRVAPPPHTFWLGSAWRRLAGAMLLALIIVPTVFVLLTATGG